MNTAIAIFVKTPGLSPVKTRLAAGIGKEAAEAFYTLSLKAVEETVCGVDISPHWAVAEEDGVDHLLWGRFPAIYTGEGNLGARQHCIYERLLEDYDRVLLIGADAPQLSSYRIEEAIGVLDRDDFVIGPAHDGGYYLFGGRVSTQAEIWRSVTWSSSQTREMLEAQLPSGAFHLPFLSDVDTRDDLARCLSEMPKQPHKRQDDLIRWISKILKLS